MKIAFVCTGNTCRSPMAEKLLKLALKQAGKTDIEVCSAGLYPTVGAPMSRLAAEALGMLGVTDTSHVAAFCDREFMSGCDLVLCMTAEHKRAVEPFCRECYTIGEYTGLTNVSDPYGGTAEDYRNTAELLREAAELIVKKLSR